LVVAVALWQVGTHVDAWYDLHYGFDIQSFLTWPHALLYGAWAVSFGLAAWRVLEYLNVLGHELVGGRRPRNVSATLLQRGAASLALERNA
jgi:hypothetical protein